MGEVVSVFFIDVYWNCYRIDSDSDIFYDIEGFFYFLGSNLIVDVECYGEGEDVFVEVYYGICFNCFVMVRVDDIGNNINNFELYVEIDYV